MEIILTLMAVAGLGAVSLASYVHRSRQRAFLTKVLEVDDSLRERVARELGVDGAVVTGVSAFDVLYNAMKMDPNALKGMDHLHHAREFENLDDLMDYMKNPDIDVITNREMADAFSDNSRVVILPALSAQEAFQNTADTFEGMADLGDGIDSIPFISLAINAGKNIHKLHKGDIDLKTAAEHTALDTAASGVGGWLGGTAGLGWGLALAPVTGGLSTVVLPILGSLAGIFTGKGISGWFKERHLRRAIEELQFLATEFRDAFVELYSNVVGAMDSFFEQHLAVAAAGIAEESFFRRMVFPSAKTTFYRMASRNLEAERTDCRSFYEDLRETVEDAEESSEGGMILFTNCQQRQQQGVDVLMDVEPLPEYYAAIEAQLEIIEKEERKIR